MSEPQNQLSIPESAGPLVVYSPEDILASTAGAEYLPRLQITAMNSKLVAGRKALPGDLVCVWTAENLKQLGQEQDILFITMRPKALRIDEKAGTILQYFNRNSDEFKKVQADSMVNDSGCMFGIEFLVYVPQIDAFAGFFCGSKTNRREAPAILKLMNKKPDTELPEYGPAMVTIKSFLIETTKYQWFGFKAIKCSAAPAKEPNPDELIEQIKKFNHPPESKVEKVDTAATGGREQ